MARGGLPNGLATEGAILLRKRMLVLCCCATLLGCGTLDPLAGELHKLTNPFGTPFRDRAEVDERLPAGTLVDKAQVEMKAHGFEQWSSQAHEDRLTLIFRPVDFGGLRDPGPVGWVILRCEHGTVVAVEVQPGPVMP